MPSGTSSSPPGPPRFLAGDGVMARRMREFDWSTTSIGDPLGWPASLRTMVGMLLSTRHPAFIFWGYELLCFYNDAYSALLGPEKHPHILGMPGRQAFPEIWHIVGADIEGVLAGGPATWHENQLVPIWRNGQLADVYWTYSYAGIDDETAPMGVGGVLVLCNETTAQVLENRQTKSDFARLAQLFEQAPSFLAVLAGPTHQFEFVNPAYRRLIAGRDAIGKTVAEALPEVVEQGYISLLDNVYRSGRAYSAFAARVGLWSDQTGQVEERRLDLVYQPTFDSSGSVTGIFVVGTDVSERLDTEMALEVREEQLRLATEASEIGLWDVDPIAQTLFWPASVRRMFGIFSDRVVTMHDDFYKGLHPADRDATTLAYAAAVDPDRRSLYDVEYRTVGNEDGVVRWVAAKGRGLFDDSDRCVRVIGTAMDITARKRDEARLRELNETLQRRLSDYLAERKLFADLVEGTSALILALDLGFNILAMNKANADEFERLYGRRPSVGDNLLQLLSGSPGLAAEVEAAWARGLGGEHIVSELEFGDPARGRRWYQIHFQPLFSAHGERIGAYQFGYDVTARREADARLAETEVALHQAQRMETIGLLTGGVAHDFNNVLQALNTKFELIRRRPDDSDAVRGWAASGVDVARRGARVTAQLLAFSRRDASGEGAVRLCDLVDNMADLLRTTIGPEITLSTQCDDVWVVADATQLEMALLNLAVNARDAMPSGGSVAIQGQLRGEGEFVEIAIADTGTGMSAEVIARAFTPFFTTKAIGKGSGLGLAQVYAMADRVGGAVRIESDGRTGTRVVISLRRAEAALLAAPVERSQPSVTATVPRSILVVDDDAQVRQSLVELLTGIGHRPLEAESGERALALLERHEVDLLLCDIAMPGMNGIALANLARVSRASLPVIFMSGHAGGDELRDALGHSGSLLRKPFDVRTVQLAIDCAPSKRRGSP